MFFFLLTILVRNKIFRKIKIGCYIYLGEIIIFFKGIFWDEENDKGNWIFSYCLFSYRLKEYVRYKILFNWNWFWF